MNPRPIGRGRRIAVLTITIALLAGGASFGVLGQPVKSVLARTLAGDTSDQDMVRTFTRQRCPFSAAMTSLQPRMWCPGSSDATDT